MEQSGYVLSGDVVSFCIDSLGFLTTASSKEPVAEKTERVSHLRIASSIHTNNESQTNILLADLRRCQFTIENDIATVCTEKQLAHLQVDMINSPLTSISTSAPHTSTFINSYF